MSAAGKPHPLHTRASPLTPALLAPTLPQCLLALFGAVVVHMHGHMCHPTCRLLILIASCVRPLAAAIAERPLLQTLHAQWNMC